MKMRPFFPMEVQVSLALRVGMILMVSVALLAAPRSRADLGNALRVQVEDEAAPLVSTIDSMQGDYFSANGRYWQGLPTHTSIPADGTTVAPDNLSSDAGGGSWVARGISFPGQTASMYKIDEYQGGYLIWQVVEEDGTRYCRSLSRVGRAAATNGWVNCEERP